MEGPGRDEQTPLLAGRLLGLRGWMIQSGAGGHPRLAAYWQQASWALGGRWTTARCLADHHPPGEPTPAGSCSCGLYAYNVNRASAEELEAEYWGRNALANPHDPERVQLIGVAGIIEAEGRIELHLDGFRAERARPHALIVGADWPAESRREVERLARACRAGVLELADSRELLEYCRAQGGALGPESVDALLEPEWEQWQHELLAAGIDQSPISHGTYPPPLPAPSEQHPRYRRILERVGELFLLALGGVAALFWYGMWAGILIALAGGILFGWGDEHFKAPARVERVFADRSSCRVDAVVRARRRPAAPPPPHRRHQPGRQGSRSSDARRRLGPEGNLEGAGGGDEAAALRLAASDHGPRPSRVREEGRSRRPGDHETQARRCQEAGRSSDRSSAMTFPGPSRTIIVEPIERPERSPAPTPDREPERTPAPGPDRPTEPAPGKEREKQPARSEG